MYSKAVELRGVVCLTVGLGGRAASRRLPADAAVVLGRGMGWGLPRDRAWVPRQLATLSPFGRGWLVANGTASVTVTGPGVRLAVFRPSALHVLTPGHWLLEWDLDKPLEASVRLRRSLTAEEKLLPLAAGEDLPPSPFETLRAGRRPEFSDEQRRRLAELFRHLLLNEPAPPKPFALAAAHLGMTENALRVYASRLLSKINADRLQQIPDLEQLGEYLVHDVQALQPSDLLRGV